MACWTEYAAYCGCAVAAGGALAAVAAELGSGVGAPLSIPTAAAAVAAVIGLVAAGMAYANCLENQGKEVEAQRMRENMDRLQRELEALQRRVGAN